jgi:PIN domain nuclease of toxin-antitoxin system
MKLLIDTHILLWWFSDDARLNENARLLISTPDNTIFVSHASLWEIQIKTMAGKLTANLQNIIQQLPENNFEQLPIHANHLLTLRMLPPHHQDPFDRMLIAQAIHEPMHLLTHDKQLSNYSELVVLV